MDRVIIIMLIASYLVGVVMALFTLLGGLAIIVAVALVHAMLIDIVKHN